MSVLNSLRLVSVCVATLATPLLIAAEEPNKPRQHSIPSVGSQLRNPSSNDPTAPSISLQQLLDQMYDYEVYVADPVSGTEWVVEVRFAGEAGWKLLGNVSYSPSTETMHFNGVRKFRNKSEAIREAQNLLKLGIIEDYFVYERLKVPSWTYVGTFDSQQEADDVANLLSTFGDMLEKVEPVSAGALLLYLSH